MSAETAKRCVLAAAETSLRHFRQGVRVDLKPDRTPVTIADKESEAAILSILGREHPTHAVLTEESGAHAGSATHRWIVDPLDGTRGFSRGGTFWGPLVALEANGEVVAGAMALPALNEMYWAARGAGAWFSRLDGTEQRKLAVSGISDWCEATLSLGELTRFLAGPHAAAVTQLSRTAASTRAFGDLAACAMLITGRAECWMESGVQIWDLAPLKILVEEAGGTFTDLHGQATIASGHAVGTNRKVQAQVMETLAALGNK